MTPKLKPGYVPNELQPKRTQKIHAGPKITPKLILLQKLCKIMKWDNQDLEHLRKCFMRERHVEQLVKRLE